MVIYIIWKKAKSQYSLNLLVMSAIGCITFKISALIIVFPIFIDLIIDLFKKNNLKGNNILIVKNILSSKICIFSMIVFFSLILNKYIITQNFLYPLLTNFFNKGDTLINEFSNMISNYQREKSFLIQIFIPLSPKQFSNTLGPISLFLLISIFISRLKNLSYKNIEIFLVNYFQFFLLILFCQWRADFYSAPLLLLFYQSDSIKRITYKTQAKYSIYLFTIGQIGITSLFLLFSVYLNFMTFIDYEKYMNKNAYGFNFSRLIEKNLPGNFLISGRNTRLYYPTNYLDNDKMKKCIFNSPKIGQNNFGIDYRNDLIYKECLQKYNINQFVSSQIPIKSTNYICKTLNSRIGSRNIFNIVPKKISYCKKSNIND